MDMRNNERRNVSSHVRVKFSQSVNQRRACFCVGGEGVKILVTTGVVGGSAQQRCEPSQPKLLQNW